MYGAMYTADPGFLGGICGGLATCAGRNVAVLGRFGRFPWDNDAHRRQTTAEEASYLQGFAGQAAAS